MRPSRAAGITYKVVVILLIVTIVAALAENDFSVVRIYRNAKIASMSLYLQLRFFYNFYTADEMHKKIEYLWDPANHKAKGVTRYDRERSYDGLTIFTGPETKVYLIDNEGNIVHQWGLPFDKVWPDPTHAVTFQTDKLIYWRQARLFPNGDIIVLYVGPMQLPYGVGVAKLDKNSNLIWKADVNGHHDLDIAENGDIYVINHAYEKNDRTGVPFIRDGIAILSPEGKLVKEIDLYKVLMENGYDRIMDLTIIDPMHVNTIEILDTDMAEHFPMFRAGDIMISARSFDAVIVLDGETYKPKWDLVGLAKRQHDPDFLENGTIRIFDNMGNMGKPGGASRLIDIDPATKSIVWQYTGTDEDPFVTIKRGAQQPLPNGNTLITESKSGRIFEITPEGETVWEYISETFDGKSVGVMSWAVRYNRDDLTFLTR